MPVLNQEGIRGETAPEKIQSSDSKSDDHSHRDIFKALNLSIHEVYSPAVLTGDNDGEAPSATAPVFPQAYEMKRFPGRVADTHKAIKDKMSRAISRAKTEESALLDFRREKIRTLPPEIGELQSLTVLNLGFNRLSALPAEIGELSNLKVLYLNDNNLKTLPPEIGQLSNLRELYLSGNPLNDLPAELEKLPKLTKLNLGINQLSLLLEMV